MKEYETVITIPEVIKEILVEHLKCSTKDIILNAQRVYDQFDRGTSNHIVTAIIKTKTKL